MIHTIGFIGLGVLGSAITQNFVAEGINVVGYDISAQACENARQAGVSLVDTPAQVSAQANVIFTCLPNARSLQSVLNEEHGLLFSDGDGHRIVEMSTLSIADKESFAKICREHGHKPIDCPVSGNRIMALNKKLTAFFSGDESDFHELQPLLELTCSKTHYVGEFGNGIKVKLCGNILNLVHNSVAAEAMVLAIKSGLDPKMFHDVIAGSGSSSAMFEVRGALMVEEDYQREGMNLSVPLKDAKIISDYAAGLYCPIPIYQVALQNYYAAAAQGHADKDAAAVCQVMERAANASRN